MKNKTFVLLWIFSAIPLYQSAMEKLSLNEETPKIFITGTDNIIATDDNAVFIQTSDCVKFAIPKTDTDAATQHFTIPSFETIINFAPVLFTPDPEKISLETSNTHPLVLSLIDSTTFFHMLRAIFYARSRYMKHKDVDKTSKKIILTLYYLETYLENKLNPETLITFIQACNFLTITNDYIFDSAAAVLLKKCENYQTYLNLQEKNKTLFKESYFNKALEKYMYTYAFTHLPVKTADFDLKLKHIVHFAQSETNQYIVTLSIPRKAATSKITKTLKLKRTLPRKLQFIAFDMLQQKRIFTVPYRQKSKDPNFFQSNRGYRLIMSTNGDIAAINVGISKFFLYNRAKNKSYYQSIDGYPWNPMFTDDGSKLFISCDYSDSSYFMIKDLATETIKKISVKGLLNFFPTPDGSYCATLTNKEKGKIQIWNSETTDCIHTIINDSIIVPHIRFFLTFNPANNHLISATKSVIRLYDFINKTHEEIDMSSNKVYEDMWNKPSLTPGHLSKDGRHFMLTSDQEYIIMNMQTRNVIKNRLPTNTVNYYCGNGEYYNTFETEDPHIITTTRTPLWYLNQPAGDLVKEYFKEKNEPKAILLQK